MQQPDWLEWAWRELGVREQAGSRDNPRIRAMFKDAGHADIARDEVAWCAAFVGACLERSGRRSTRSLMARSYLGWGVPLEAAQLGALAVLSRDSDPALGHVGFIVGEAGEQFQLLGGNQGQEVSVQSFPKSRVIGLRWPKDASSAASTGETAKAEASGTVVRGEAQTQTQTQTQTPAAAPAQLPATVADSGFGPALAHVLEMEGGFSDDAHDPGGPTNKGITLAVYAKWIGAANDEKNRARLVQRLKRIPDAMVREIYETRYWLPAGCEAMPAPLAIMHFDAAVNHGVGTAIRMLQEAVGAGVDGEIGPETRAAIEARPLRATLVRYADIRRERYRALPHFWRFGRGWLNRVDLTLAEAARRMSGRGNGQLTKRSSTHEGERDMTNENVAASRPQAKWWGESMTIWGVIVTALSTVLPVIGPVIGIDVSGEMVRMLGEQVVQIAQAIGGLVGTLMAIYGRMRAEAPIERRAVSLRL